jgi:hypothetical protein
MKQKRLSVLVAAAAAIAILLLLIFWSRPSSRPGPVRDPGTENGEVVDTTAEDLTVELVYPMESANVHRFGPPDEWYAAGAKGETYAGALTGDGFRIDATTEAFLGQSPPDGPYLPDYRIGRAYLGWDTSELPGDAEILSATLVLDLPAGGGREKAFDIVVYQSDRTSPISLEDWQSPSRQVMGRWHLSTSRIEERETVHTDQGITLYAPEPARTVRVSLDPAVIEARGVTRLELRHAGEGVLPVTAESLSLGRVNSDIIVYQKQRPESVPPS